MNKIHNKNFTMTKTKRFSRLIAFLLVMLMMVAVELPTFALVQYDPNFTDWIQGWTGSGQISLLIGHGANNSLTVVTNTNVSGDHQWWVEPNGGGYLLQAGDKGEDIVQIRIVCYKAVRIIMECSVSLD